MTPAVRIPVDGGREILLEVPSSLLAGGADVPEDAQRCCQTAKKEKMKSLDDRNYCRPLTVVTYLPVRQLKDGWTGSRRVNGRSGNDW
jgi:hypothetical protein